MIKVFRSTKNGRKRVNEMWVVMRNGDPKFAHVYLGGAMGTVIAEFDLPDMDFLEQKRDSKNRISWLAGEEPDGTYWEIIRTPLGLNS